LNKILINFSHPAKSKSKINAALLKAVLGLESVTINDLYDNYPDFMIDIRREQALCEEHDVIIFLYPFYWYQAPSIVKEWLDLVLEHGWAYGSKGKSLKGKLFTLAITAGGDGLSYTKEGVNGFTINELISPFIATSNLCSMRWVEPFTVLGVHRGLPEKQLLTEAENFRSFILNLRDGEIKGERA